MNYAESLAHLTNQTMVDEVVPKPDPFIRGETIDDLMRLAIQQILSAGLTIHPTRGPAREVSGALLELSNPRSRISLTETRGKPFSCLGELCWYLAQTNDLEFISYYIPDYSHHSDGLGGYGKRLFDRNGLNQFENVAALLECRRDSRRAVIQLFDGSDILESERDVPCTCTLQFMVRDNKLNLICYMRSNDAFLGFPHDVFCFTMLQEMMAAILFLDLGTYRHIVGSLHLYEEHIASAEQFLNEGWQPTTSPMPPMPAGDPRPQISALLKAEHEIRTTGDIVVGGLDKVDKYWADLVRMLLVFRYWRDKRFDDICVVRDSMSSGVYAPYVNRKLKQRNRV